MKNNDELVKILTAKDEKLAAEAASEIINCANTDAFRILTEKADVLFDFVKQNVSNRLKNACNERNYRNLIKFFDYYSADFEEAIVSSLARYASEELTDEMLELLENGSDNQKIYSAGYFSLIPDTAAQELLVQYAFCDNEQLTFNAANALGIMKDKSARKKAEAMLDSEDDFDKFKAVKFLIAYGDKAALPLIYKAMKTSSFAENIAGEIPYLVDLAEMLRSEQRETAFCCISNILSGLPEILPLSQVFQYNLYEVLSGLLEINSGQESDSQAASILLKALSKFRLINSADEYTFDEDKNTKAELKEILGMLESSGEKFWNEQKELVFKELEQEDYRVLTALENIGEFGASGHVDLVLKVLENKNEIIICETVAILAKNNALNPADKDKILSRVKDDNIKAIISNYF